ncbi:response regulator [Fibrella arboris]|uniref:response regulator n=1 Tax=Fibrella arboris TaxID=3242486 RepID=UPI00351F976F
MDTLSLRIILVDDDAADRELIHWALASAIQPIQIDEMTTGQELIDWLAHQRSLNAQHVPPDNSFVTIILLDIHMPAMTGLETVRLLGDMRNLPYIPVVVLAATMNEQLKQQAYEQGIHLYMVKPTRSGGVHRVVEAVKLCYRDTLRLREQSEIL